MHKIVDAIINICPNCKKKVNFTEEQLQEYDGHHLEIDCPHCDKLCCFVCEYVYSDYFQKRMKENKLCQ